MLAKLRTLNLLSVFLAAKGTLLVCCTLYFCFLLFSTLTNTFLIPANDLLGDISSISKGELWRIVTSSVYFSDWEPLIKTVLAILMIGPFIEWKIGSRAFVISFFAASWIGAGLICFGFNGIIQSTVGLNTYIDAFYGATLAVYALFPLAGLVFAIKSPPFSLLTKLVTTGAFLGDLILVFWANANRSDPAIVVRIGQLCGVLGGIVCALGIITLKNWKQRHFFLAKSNN